MVLPA